MKKYLTVHCTGTGPLEQPTHRDIDQRDRRRGFSQIGYHYVIERDGTIKEGRDPESASVHDKFDIAKDSLSVCLVGPPGNFTVKQQHSLLEMSISHKLLKVISAMNDASDENLFRWITKQLANE